MELEKHVTGADVSHDGLRIFPFSNSLEYRGSFGFWPRLNSPENLVEDGLRCLKLVEFSLELAMLQRWLL